MLRTLYFFVFFWVHQLLIYPYQRLLRRRRNPETRGREVRIPAWNVAHHWAKLVLLWGGVKVQVVGNKGFPKDQNFLIVSNHQGTFDIPILLGTLEVPLGFVAKKELGRIPMISWWMRLIGCIFLDRENRRIQVQQIRETVENLKEGHSMVIFPEGTRSGGGRMGEFSKGSLNIAIKAGVPILPVTLKDSYTVMSAGGKQIKGGTVLLTLHEIVDPALLSKEDQADLHSRVREVIAAVL